MITLCIRYTFNPDKLADVRTYFEEEQKVIERSGGRIVGYSADPVRRAEQRRAGPDRPRC